MQNGKQKFTVSGVCCSTEEAVLRRSLDAAIGSGAYAFNPVTCELAVTGPANADRIIRSVRAAGFDARSRQEVVESTTFWRRHGTAAWTIAAALLTIAGLIAQGMAASDFVADTLLVAAVLVGGWRIAWKALLALRVRTLDMNVLMTVATIGAVAIGKLGEGAVVIALFSVSLMLESYSVSRSRRAIHSLMENSPRRARVLRNGTEVSVDAGEVNPGDRIVIRPGEQVPLDGTVSTGSSELDQSAITGEAAPVAKTEGSEVFAGSINGRGSLIISTTHRYEDTRLAHIVQLVEDAQQRRASVQNTVDAFASRYTPAVLILATLIAIVPPLFLHAEGTLWLYRALVLLVISCPCALVISTPITLVGALTAAARRGILVKGGRQLEILSKLRAMAFDKTGTLTRGRPSVTDVVSLNSHTRENVLHLVTAIERGSEHHVATAVMSEPVLNGGEELQVENFEALPGLGVRATIAGREYFLGNHRLCERQGYCSPEVEGVLERLTQEGKTAVVLGRGREAVGIVAVSDSVRPESRNAIAELHSSGLEHIVLLSGDNDRAVERLAREVGLQSMEAGLMPEEKVAAVRRLQERYGTVAMVGDGINDAPALAASSVGIAMGVRGSDAALDTADVVLMADDLSRLPLLLRLSTKTMALVRQNIAIALAVKLCFLALGLTGVATLWMAILADDGAALFVILNGLRTLSFREDA